jgi:hypothetical protein
MIFGTQMYHEELQVRFEYGCDPIIIEGLLHFLKMGSVHFLIDGKMDSNDIWYADVS